MQRIHFLELNILRKAFIMILIMIFLQTFLDLKFAVNSLLSSEVCVPPFSHCHHPTVF